MLISTGILMETFSSCATVAIYKTEIADNKIAVPVSLFAKTDLQIINAKNNKYDIALRKEKNGSYSALLLRCTHANNPLMKTGTGFTCSLHGSTFNKEGAVTKGPAEQSLTKYATQLVAEQIIISLQ